MQQIEALDEELFWWINSHHNEVLDWIMWTFSAKWSWAIIILAVYLFVTLLKDRKNWLWVLVGIVLCFLLADQISNNAIKDGVMRLRPCHALENVHMFREGPGGQYGFVSSHAANVFAILMFFSLMYGGRGNGRRPLLPYLLVLWGVIVCYSRAYLGKHYPGDLICGALLGLGVGAVVYFAISKIRAKISSKSSA